MKNNLTLSLGLDVKQFHEGLDEICRHFADHRPDDYVSGLVQKVVEAKESLFESMYIASAKSGVLKESQTLNGRISALAHYLDLCACDTDAEVKASARLVRRQLRAYGKSLAHMRVDSRLTAVEALLRDLGGDEFLPHVKRLPELPTRLAEIGNAKDDLRRQRLLVDQIKSSMVKPEPLLELKREAATQLLTLVAYLEVMAAKDAAVYGEDYDLVTEVIKRLNARRRSKASRFDDDDFEDEEIIEEPESSTEA
jgi:hypothetical protein